MGDMEITPESMIERVARAICRQFGNNPDVLGGKPNDLSPEWTLWVDEARAAIEAVADPMQKGEKT